MKPSPEIYSVIPENSIVLPAELTTLSTVITHGIPGINIVEDTDPMKDINRDDYNESVSNLVAKYNKK